MASSNERSKKPYLKIDPDKNPDEKPNKNIENGLEERKDKKKEYKPRESTQVQLDSLANLFWNNHPYQPDAKKQHEFEIRFGTRNIKPLTKIDYDNVVRKLKSLGFYSLNVNGEYMLRINNEFLDSVTGNFKKSQIRTEIKGFNGIQDYCKHNDITKIVDSYNYEIMFQKKMPYFNGDKKAFPVNVDDFNFRASYQIEEEIPKSSGQIKYMLSSWAKTKKYFRYFNRVTFIHDELPIKVDLSIVKSSRFNYETKQEEMTYTTDEAGLFSNPEIYEIELEVDNSKIGPGSSTNTVEKLLVSIRKAIKYVLMGLQGTNYIISYPEQREVLNDYMKLIMGDEYDPVKNSRVFSNNFIGPSSYTLQMANIAPISEKTTIPNIRNNYTVTDKADGQRFMMYISGTGKIYLINNSMQVLFSGAITQNKDIFHSLVDGENILHDKHGNFINLYAAFDIYFINKRDIRSLGFVPRKADDAPNNFRLTILKNLIRSIQIESVIPGNNERSPLRVECKKFYPVNPADDIFSACASVLQREEDGLLEYNTDGLIFTPASMGVGADRIGKIGSLNRTITWEYSFKWKPAEYNTIDFLVKTIKNGSGTDVVTPLFQNGIDTTAITQLDEYKSIVLCVGFNLADHGFINPCQDVLDDKLPEYKNIDNEKDYKPAEFVPTNPTKQGAGVCNIMLRKDDSGIKQMFTEEGEVFQDGNIVEFRYDIDRQNNWNWIPLRFRADKTARYKQGLPEYGNAYHVANSNWHSINNPITREMIATGNNIPDILEDEDVYYNNAGSNSKMTRGLRDFHNLFVKKLLITSVSRRGDTLIDYACGKAGDFPKWIEANLSFVFGIDVSKDNLENRINGACARFLTYRKDFKNVPYALFVNGNSAANVRSGSAMLNDKAIQITKAVFGEGKKDGVDEKLGKAVMRQFGKGENGFNISSCQFALHYFFESQSTFQNYMRNVSECTKVGGYFIGSCYDGKIIFEALKKKMPGESIEIHEEDKKIWEIRKEYDVDHFDDDMSSIGYKISVYQESINKMFPEFLVNFDYLERVMENYGFKLITREEAKNMGLPEGSGMFSELYNLMLEETKRKKYKQSPYKSALDMKAYEKRISFLNRYFVYKKIRDVNAEKIALEYLDESMEEAKLEEKESAIGVEVGKKEVKATKPKVRKLTNKLILTAATEAVDIDQPKEEIVVEKSAEKVSKPKKPRKVKLIIQGDNEAVKEPIKEGEKEQEKAEQEQEQEQGEQEQGEQEQREQEKVEESIKKAPKYIKSDARKRY